MADGARKKAYDTCDARKRQGGDPCTRPAGWGTDHPGVGRCKLHGGCSPIKHGRYSQIANAKIAELAAKFEGDENPLDMRAELAQMRAHYELVCMRLTEMSETGEVAGSADLLERVTRIAERIMKLESDDAVSRKDLMRIMTDMGRGVDEYVKDPAVVEKIRAHWLSIPIA